MGLKTLLEQRRAQAGPNKDRIAEAIAAVTAERRTAQEQYDQAKLQQLNAATRGERDQMEELVQRIGGVARLLDEALVKLNEAHYNLDGIAERDGALGKQLGLDPLEGALP